MSFDLKWFDCKILILLLKFLLYSVYNLISDVVDMSASFTSAYAVYKGHLFELSIRNRQHNLPSFVVDILVSHTSWTRFSLGLAWEVHPYVFEEGVSCDLSAI